MAMQAGIFWAVAGGVKALTRLLRAGEGTSRHGEIFLTGGDAELLEDLVAAAVNAGMAKAREAAAQSLSGMTGGLPMGLFPGFGGASSPPTGPDAGGS